jgi:hypothetical protein
MSEIAFTSVLGREHKQELERLLFFNDNQRKVTESVATVARRYGVPRIHVVAERLRVALESVDAQTLFAVRRARTGAVEPVGVTVYTREDDALVVLVVAVHEDFAARGPMADERLLLRMTDEVRGIARRVRGVRSVLVFIGRPTPMRLPVDRSPGRPDRR